MGAFARAAGSLSSGGLHLTLTPGSHGGHHRPCRKSGSSLTTMRVSSPISLHLIMNVSVVFRSKLFY